MECSNSLCRRPLSKVRFCPTCKVRAYCSQNCRLSDWYAGHQSACGVSAPSHLDMKEFELGGVLGRGAFGDVRLVKYRSTGQYFALKAVHTTQIDKRKLLQADRKTALQKEISLLSTLSHPHLIRLFHHFEDPSSVYLALELAAKGSLLQAMQTHQRLTETQARHYFLQTCAGIRYLHGLSLIHRAIRPQNLFIDHCDDIKIGGLGSCAHSSESENTYYGSLNYAAPEVLQGVKQSLAVDIWALGVCLYEMTHGNAPFEGGSETDKCKKILAGEWTMSADLSPQLKNLLTALLRTIPEERPSIEAVLEHPWVQNKSEAGYYDEEKSVESPYLSNQLIYMSPSGVGLELETPKQVPFPTPELIRMADSQERRTSAAKIRGLGVLLSGYTTDEEFFRTFTERSETTPRHSISVPSFVPSLQPIPAKDLEESASPTFSLEHLIPAAPASVDANESQSEEVVVHTSELDAQLSRYEEPELKTEEVKEGPANPFPRITPTGLLLRHQTMDQLLSDPDVRHSFRKNPTRRQVEEHAFLHWIGSFLGCTDRC